MDAGILVTKITSRSKDENFDKDRDTAIPEAVRLMNAVSWVITFVVGLPAAYLSWYSNSVIGWGAVPKTIFAIFAFGFGGTYIVDFVLYKWDMLRFINTLN